MKLGTMFICCLLGLSAAAQAQTPATGRDYSDLWWNAAESGWGANVIQQDSVLFITIFLYGADGRPTWYVAPAVSYVSSNGAGDDTYRGDLYQTTGTPFTAPSFNPGATNSTIVGTLTFTGLAAGGATLSYNVNGLTTGNLTKSLARQTWRTNAVNGVQYVGSTSYVRSQCLNPGMNGAQVDGATYTLTVTNGTLRLVEDNGPGGICNWNGNYTQAGRYGQSTGTVICEGDPVPSTYTFTQLYVSSQAFSANWTASGNCNAVGRIGGPRR